MCTVILPDFFLLRALGEQHEAADKIAQGNATWSATAGRIQPVGDGDGHALSEHVLRKRMPAERLLTAASRQPLECLAHSLELHIGH